LVFSLPKLGIRGKLVALMALSMLAPLLFADVIIMSRVQSQLLAASRERLAADSRLVAVQVEETSRSVRAALTHLAADPDLMAPDPARRDLAISQFMAATDRFDAIRLTGPDGILKNPPSGVAPVTDADRRWFKALLAGAPYAQEKVFGRITGELSVVSGVPIKVDGQIIAILAGVRLSTRVASAVGVTHPTNGSHQAIFDAAGDMIAGIETAPPQVTAAIKQIVRDRVLGNSECMVGSEQYLTHTAELADGWTVVTIRSAPEATKGAFTTLIWAASGLVAAVCAALIGGWLIAGRITGPIRETAQAAKAMASGNLSQRVRVNGTDELATLGASFNAMADALGTQYRAVESRVAARTADLAASNRKLETARQLAEAAGMAKSNFLANVSHEFRTPMMAITGYCELMQDSALLPEDRQAYLSSVLRNVRRLTQIVGDVLDLSRVEIGAIEIRFEPCLFRNILAAATAGAKDAAAAKKLSLEITVDTDVPANLRTDGRRVRQLIANLVGNAVKFTTQGKVNVHVSWSAWAQPAADNGAFTLETSSAGMLRIDVSDNGPGMTAAEIANVRQPFFQGDSTSTRKNGGLGTGLPLSFAIAEALGGSIEITPFNAAGGTRVVIELPADECTGEASEVSSSVVADRRNRPVPKLPIEAQDKIPTVIIASPCPVSAGAAPEIPAPITPVPETPLPETPATPITAASAEPPASSAPPALKPKPLIGKRVLVVDDGEDNRRLLKTHSLTMGATVELAENGQQAVDLICAAAASDQPFDIVLLDMQMPVMDGYTAATELRSMGYHLPIIAVTAHAMAGDKDKCLQAGCSDYLAKPVQRDRLRETVERNLPSSAAAV